MQARRLTVTAAMFTLAFVVIGMKDHALATQVGCGDVITEDTTLDSDLVDCPGDGLVIGADGITLDLAGHTVAGAQSCSAGVHNSGHTDVRIVNGAVSGGCYGIRLEGARRNILKNLNVFSEDFGISLEESDNNDVTANVVDGLFLSAIDLSRSNGNRLQRNWVSTVLGVQISLFDSANNRVERNTSGRPSAGVSADGSGPVPHTLATSSGIVLSSSDRNWIVRNVVTGGATGGIILFGSNDNAIVRNVASSNGIPSFPSVVPASGIAIGESCQRTLVERNVTNNNTDDGIQVDSPATRLVHNAADENLDLGIDAVAGVIDGGGNTASGNGNPLQCLNVVCQ